MARVEYLEEFYCGFCGCRFKQGEERHDIIGRVICPKDGTPMRVKPRGKNNSYKRDFEHLAYLKEKSEIH